MTEDIPSTDWYIKLLDAVRDWHDGELDKLGNLQYLHFDRVARRLLRLFPDATRAQVEAALLHDVLEPTGKPALDFAALGVGPEAVEIIRLLTLPTDGRSYLEFIADLAASGNVGAIQVKLADNLDATEFYNTRATPEAQEIVEGTYNPSRRILQSALIRLATAAA